MMEVHIEEHLISNIEKGITDQPTAFFNTDRPILEGSLCISCGKCAKVCPVNAIEMIVVGTNEKGREIKHPKVDSKICIACSNCILDCPKDALKMDEVL